MKKYIVLSVNDNPKYLFFVPLMVFAWSQFGWWPVIFYHGEWGKLAKFTFNELDGFAFELDTIPQYKSETITQVSRLYGACVANGYLMTSDIDLMPLSDYWHPNENEITSYGRDLSDRHYPIAYIGMSSDKWREVMNIDGTDYQYHMRRDLRQQENMWTLDQDLITEKLTYRPQKTRIIKRIDRGTDKRTGYPLGRVDRSNWRLDHDVLIDAHLPHDILTNEASFKKVLELLHVVWPKENWAWFISYYKEFKKLSHG
jgi:hypothetical protein